MTTIPSHWQQRAQILATCARAVPPFLKMELHRLSYPIIGETDTAITTEGTLMDCMQLNLWLRTAHRIYWHVASFLAGTPDTFYRELSKLPWETWISPHGYLTVSSSVHNSTIKDYRYANLKCKDAICDRLRSVAGRRPNSGSKMKGASVYVYWDQQEVAVYLDTTGPALAKRGYRLHTVQAPMQETLAAAVVLATDWSGEEHFVNPMCGSGTLAIEAALLGSQRAPALTRSEFAFMHLKGYEPGWWATLRDEALHSVRAPFGSRIVATDLDKNAVEIAKENAARAGVSEWIEFHVCDFTATPMPPGGGVIVMNPEYGERTGTVQTLIPVYRRIGDFFKLCGPAWRGYVFTGNAKLFNKVSLRCDRQWTFFSGGIECRLLEFRIYARKAPYGAGCAAAHDRRKEKAI